MRTHAVTIARILLVLTSFVVGSVGTARLLAQQASPAFEVASIKTNRSGAGGSSMRFSTGRVTMANVPLKKVILTAYGIPDDHQYAAVGPDWLVTEHFDIQATFSPDAEVQQVRQMLQGLLAERFRLTLHQERRQLPMFALVVAKNGPRIHPVEEGQSQTRGDAGRLEATKITMQKLADLLARMTEHEVEDRTGLAGVFDFTLEWSPLDTPAIEPSANGAAGATDGPSLVTALQEQLGLRLESTKGPVDVLVIDHVEHPTEN
jgi:uncharacterized protein (TIGR03435 family)